MDGHELRLIAEYLAAFCHAHHAVMLAVLAAARRQVCLTLWRQSKERGGERKAEDGQQRDGDEFTQYLIQTPFRSTLQFGMAQLASFTHRRKAILMVSRANCVSGRGSP